MESKNFLATEYKFFCFPFLSGMLLHIQTQICKNVRQETCWVFDVYTFNPVKFIKVVTYIFKGNGK